MSNKSTQKSTLDSDVLIDKEKSSQGDGQEVSLKEYAKNAPFAFDKANYRLLLIGLGINVLGFILMIGGATEDPNKFSEEDLFSTTRITIAPLLIVIGYVVILYAIMKKNKNKEAE